MRHNSAEQFSHRRESPFTRICGMIKNIIYPGFTSKSNPPLHPPPPPPSRYSEVPVRVSGFQLRMTSLDWVLRAPSLDAVEYKVDGTDKKCKGHRQDSNLRYLQLTLKVQRLRELSHRHSQMLWNSKYHQRKRPQF
ncbi:hypothetical protein J6590_038804 [Homalodisca vitripennis]|nr:hypothetical protein J6590_038804 [Homalodisca vitripennis]